MALVDHESGAPFALLNFDDDGGEDACLTRTGNGPAHRASLNNIALAMIFANRREMESLAETRRRLQLNRSEAIAALTRP